MMVGVKGMPDIALANDGVDHTDSLTGLMSVNSFYERSKAAIDSVGLGEIAFHIVYFNIENMKTYNERFGMTAGDELLVYLAQRIEASFEHVLLSRVADDRFVLLTYGDDLQQGITHVYEGVLGYSSELRTVVRAGVYEYGGDKDMALACDRAKLACDYIRGRYDVYWRQYDEGLLEMRRHKQYILDRFDRALKEGHIRVYFQPIVRTIGRRMSQVEALARWIDPDEGFISPGDFIPVLEESRLVHRLDIHIIELACQSYADMVARNLPPIAANVNLSRLDLDLCDIVTETHELMTRYNVPARMINIEITESAFSHNSDLLRQTIDRFHDLGMQVWMDDFGSGYSSLNVLREFPFDVIKFDMSFLRHRDEASLAKSRSMLPHIITMVKDLGFQTLVEGVETQEQLDFLEKIGCEKVQGYYFAKPAPMEELSKKVISGELGVEPPSQQAYMDKIGRVDLMDPTTIDRNLGDEIGLSSGLPAAVVEFHANTVRYLSWNSSYLVYLRDIGMHTIENSTKQMNDLSRPQSQGFFGAAAKKRGDPEWVNIAFYEGEDLCTGRARCIAVDDEADTCAFVYIAFNISRFLEKAGHKLPK